MTSEPTPALPRDPPPFDTRLNEVEIKLAYAEDLLETLNQTVFRQQEQLAFLQRHVIELQRQMQSLPPAQGTTLRDELPPHY